MAPHLTWRGPHFIVVLAGLLTDEVESHATLSKPLSSRESWLEIVVLTSGAKFGIHELRCWDVALGHPADASKSVLLSPQSRMLKKSSAQPAIAVFHIDARPYNHVHVGVDLSRPRGSGNT